MYKSTININVVGVIIKFSHIGSWQTMLYYYCFRLEIDQKISIQKETYGSINFPDKKSHLKCFQWAKMKLKPNN